MRREGTSKSGWCLAGPPGSVPQHRWCKAPLCRCECHEESEDKR